MARTQRDLEEAMARYKALTAPRVEFIGGPPDGDFGYPHCEYVPTSPYGITPTTTTPPAAPTSTWDRRGDD